MTNCWVSVRDWQEEYWPAERSPAAPADAGEPEEPTVEEAPERR